MAVWMQAAFWDRFVGLHKLLLQRNFILHSLALRIYLLSCGLNIGRCE